MEIEIVKCGGRVLWNHFARIYDEKPDRVKVSMRQRTRWAQGHWYVAFNNAKPLLKCTFTRPKKMRYIDQLIYLFGMSRSIAFMLMLLTVVFIIFYTILDFSGLYSTLVESVKAILMVVIPTTYTNIALFAYSMCFTTLYAMYTDGVKFNPIKTIIAVFYSSFLCIFTQIAGLFKWKKQGVWVKTPHCYTSENRKKGKRGERVAVVKKRQPELAVKNK